MKLLIVPVAVLLSTLQLSRYVCEIRLCSHFGLISIAYPLWFVKYFSEENLLVSFISIFDHLLDI